MKGTRIFSGLFLFVFIFFASVWSAEFFVDCGHPHASDSNPGTADSPWLTIQKAADTMLAGDIVYVNPGLYNERVQPINSGAPLRPITYKAQGPGVVVRGFQLVGKAYLQLIGFEITHSNYSTRDSGIQLNNSSNCQILDNYIHHTFGDAIDLHYNTFCNNNTIRGNRIAYAGINESTTLGAHGIILRGNRNVAEYNDISHVNDFTNVFGENNVVRNNYFHDCYYDETPEWNATYPEGHHLDGVQVWGESAMVRRCLVENNFWRDTATLSNSHFLMAQDTQKLGINELLLRNNVVTRNGSYVAIVIELDYARFVNNTFVDTSAYYPANGKVWQSLSFQAGALGGRVVNNIFYNACRSTGHPYSFAEAASAFADYNLSFNSGTLAEAHGLNNLNPLFRAYSVDDFRLTGDSPCCNSAGALTSTKGSGSGLTVYVQDSKYFTDGWGIIEPDWIKVGANPAQKICAIDDAANCITVESPITWNAGDNVFLANPNSVFIDRGAYPFRADDNYDYEVTITKPADNSLVSGNVEVSAAVTNADVVRQVMFYMNGVAQATVDHEPYVCTLNTTGITAGSFTIEARAYSRYANPTLLKSAQVTCLLSPLQVISPNGGGNWQKGTTQSILWIHNDLSGNLNIELYQGEDKVADIGTAAVSAGSYVWTVDNGLADGNDYRVRIYQGDEEDYSDKAFSISSGVSSYVVKFYSSSGGSVSGTLNQTIAAGGSTTPVTAVPNSGYSFSSWTGTNGFAGSSNPLTLTNVQYDMSITAHFSYVASGVVADFDNNAVTDLVWRHYAVDGGNVLWLMNAATAGTVAGEGDNEVEAEENNEVQGAGLKVEGEEENRGNDREGYFVGAGYYPAQDEVADIHESTLPAGEGISTEYPEPEYGGPFGAISIMSKVSLPALANNSWKICGTGDFDNDGYQDILWRYYSTGGSNAVWLMEGTNRLSSVAIPAQTDLKWEMVGTGDFNNDKKVDILWRHKGSGKNMIWLMNGLTRSSIVNLPTQTNLSWKIVGCADFNGDQKVDILWRFQGTGGKNQVWLMNGTVRQSTVNIKVETNVKWQIAGVGDFNQDGKPDIIWRNYSTGGANRIWLMNNTAFVRSATLPAVTDLTWKIEN